VKRGSPQPRLGSVGPEPPGHGGARLRTSDAAAGKREERRSRGRARSRKAPESSATARAHQRAPKGGRAPRTVAALGKRRSTGARVETVSECRSRSDATFGRDDRERLQAPAETRDLARRNRSRPETRRRRRERAKGWRGPARRLLTMETRELARAVRASLVGIASGGVRARGLGKCQGRERTSRRYDGRVSGSWVTSL
jgi:hypothetical protein